MVRKLCLLAFLSVILSIEQLEGSTILREPQNDVDHDSYRLLEGIVPISYDLWLYTRLGLNDFDYQGRVNITLRVNCSTDAIVVHNDGLIIWEEKSKLYLQTDGGTNLTAVSIDNQLYDNRRQFFILKLPTKLSPGIYVLELQFAGEVRDDVFGFYRSSYVKDGEIRWMGITQFSPVYARRAFPCLDEPKMKATFTLHIGHVKNQMVTSNTPVATTVKYSYRNYTNYYVTTFSPTPRMSTYLVGWAVHDFVPETTASSTLNFKMWTRQSMHRRGSIALNQGVSIYSFLRDWLAIENPVPKMDQIAVPDFNFNAMENWGMITYRESVVLHENAVTPTRYMYNGLTTMAHEYAHTWFGNLVTPSFWNVAWLKEGFASYFQYYALSIVQPTWTMMDKFVVDMLQPTLAMDSANHTRVMNGRNVESPKSIMAVLDFVSYKKGASVIRMLAHVTGESAFQTGLRSYLKDLSYEAATPFDLYEHLQSSMNISSQLQTNISIKTMMETWTNQPAFPLVTVTRDYKRQTISVSQKRFCENLDQCDRETDKWWVPLNFASRSSLADFSHTTAKSWLKPEDKSLTIGPFASEDWVIFNVQQTGYYRVNYDEKNWQLLIDYLNSKDFRGIHKVNRASLVDDVFNLAKGGYIDYSIAFDLSNYLVQEFDYEPWLAAVNNFKFLNKMLSNVPDAQRAFQNHVEGLLGPIYKRLSFDESTNDDVVVKLHRELILSTACLVRNPHCLRMSQSLYEKWTFNERILQDAKSFVYCEGIRSGTDRDWYRMLGKWMLTDLHTEQELLLQALGCTRNTHLIDKYLAMTLSEEPRVRSQYRITIINAVLEGDVQNVNRVLEYLRLNLQKIISLRSHSFLGKVITAVGNAITSKEQAEQLRLLVDENLKELNEILATAKQAIAVSSANVKWVQKYSSVIADRLNQYMYTVFEKKEITIN
ncbi:aminopeptidase N-like isoform X1 [Nomia melanderi]|uniref:aminopeptidase N-like isoform X1 n=2 Tax=Nomia melanderi TaxID=2448451 RepID=UPI003FCE67B3